MTPSRHGSSSWPFVDGRAGAWVSTGGCTTLTTVRAEDVRAYLGRDWALFERARIDHWRELARTSGIGPALQVAEAMREHVARHATPKVLAADRAADWEHHLEMKRRIDAASSALRR